MALPATEEDPFPEIDGHSRPIRQLKHRMLLAARDPFVTILIQGESGTGKEVVARALHRASPRGRAPFVVVNCAGLAPTLVEDELFGHVRGAFTGAADTKAGPFERASGGTVLLDEVGELTSDLQMKLLRALQQRSVQRLGGTHERPFDVRVIAATNADLARATARGQFREDLYYRLKVYPLTIPPLRHRGPSDLAALATTILARSAGRRRRPAPTIDPEALDRLIRYDWPGNVRELENTLEYMLVSAAGRARLSTSELPESFGTRATPLARRTPPSAADLVDLLGREGITRAKAADELGLSRHQLYRLLKRYGVYGRTGRP